MGATWARSRPDREDNGGVKYLYILLAAVFAANLEGGWMVAMGMILTLPLLAGLDFGHWLSRRAGRRHRDTP